MSSSTNERNLLVQPMVILGDSDYMSDSSGSCSDSRIPCGSCNDYAIQTYYSTLAPSANTEAGLRNCGAQIHNNLIRSDKRVLDNSTLPGKYICTTTDEAPATISQSVPGDIIYIPPDKDQLSTLICIEEHISGASNQRETQFSTDIIKSTTNSLPVSITAGSDFKLLNLAPRNSSKYSLENPKEITQNWEISKTPYAFGTTDTPTTKGNISKGKIDITLGLELEMIAFGPVKEENIYTEVTKFLDKNPVLSSEFWSPRIGHSPDRSKFLVMYDPSILPEIALSVGFDLPDEGGVVFADSDFRSEEEHSWARLRAGRMVRCKKWLPPVDKPWKIIIPVDDNEGRECFWGNLDYDPEFEESIAVLFLECESNKPPAYPEDSNLGCPASRWIPEPFGIRKLKPIKQTKAAKLANLDEDGKIEDQAEQNGRSVIDSNKQLARLGQEDSWRIVTPEPNESLPNETCYWNVTELETVQTAFRMDDHNYEPDSESETGRENTDNPENIACEADTMDTNQAANWVVWTGREAIDGSENGSQSSEISGQGDIFEFCNDSGYFSVDKISRSISFDRRASNEDKDDEKTDYFECNTKSVYGEDRDTGTFGSTWKKATQKAIRKATRKATRKIENEASLMAFQLYYDEDPNLGGDILCERMVHASTPQTSDDTLIKKPKKRKKRDTKNKHPELSRKNWRQKKQAVRWRIDRKKLRKQLQETSRRNRQINKHTEISEYDDTFVEILLDLIDWNESFWEPSEIFQPGYQARESTVEPEWSAPSTNVSSMIVDWEEPILPLRRLGYDRFAKPKGPTRTGHGVEVCTPIMAAESSEFIVKTLMRQLKSRFQLEFNTTCGLHVHIGCGKGNHWTLFDMKNIAKAIVLFEDVIDLMHPPHRSARTENWLIKSNRHNPLLSRLSVFRIFEKLDMRVNEQHNDTVFLEMIGAQKFFKYNFSCNATYGTIEFRQAAGHCDENDMCEWLRFVVQFVEAALDTTDDVWLEYATIIRQGLKEVDDIRLLSQDVFDRFGIKRRFVKVFVPKLN